MSKILTIAGLSHSSPTLNILKLYANLILSFRYLHVITGTDFSKRCNIWAMSEFVFLSLKPSLRFNKDNRLMRS